MFEFFGDCFRSVLRQGGELLGFFGSEQERECERFGIALGDEHAADSVLDRFGNSAVSGGENGETAGHGFEHGVGHAFLVAIGAGLARMEEEVRLLEEGAQLALRNKAGEDDAVGDLQIARELA